MKFPSARGDVAIDSRHAQAAPRRSSGGAFSGDRIEGVLLVSAIFAFLLAILGGSSRYDMIQLPILLPISCLAAAYGLFRSWEADWSGLKTPLVILMLWTGWILLQLVPLPPDLWHALPGREPLAKLAEALGENRWRPLSMVPWRTQYALWAMAYPLAALFLFVALRDKAVRATLWAVIAIALASAFMGILQLTSGVDSPFYTYALTIRTAPVGLFANPNHTAIMNATVMVVIAATAKLSPRPVPAWRMPVLGSIFFVLVIMQLVNGSRAGLIATLIALATSALVLLLGNAAPATSKRNPKRKGPLPAAMTSPGGLAMIVVAVAVLGVLALFYLQDRSPGFNELIASSPMEDLRFQLFPVLTEMARTYFPWGIGFGAFENVFYMHEPTEMLQPSYVNQAHDDLLQIVIEGGLIALGLVLAALRWLANIVFRLLRGDHRQRTLGIAASGALAIVLIGSAFDYPLRAPLFQGIAVCLVCVLARLDTVYRASAGDRPDEGTQFPFLNRLRQLRGSPEGRKP